MCVQVADFLIRVEHVEWAVVTGIVGDTLIVVFRNDGLKKDAGYLARTAFDSIGSAGGHLSMGRAEIQQGNLPEGTRLTDNSGIERFVLGSLAGYALGRLVTGPRPAESGSDGTWWLSGMAKH